MRHVIRTLFTCLLVCYAATGIAQVPPVHVRAGEHSDYTRLILQLPEENQWQFTHNTGAARLEISGPPVEFDLTQTFSRIPRTRLRDIRMSRGGLDLTIICDCDIRVQQDIPPFLIIDIVGAPSHIVYAPQRSIRPPPRPAVPAPTATPDPRRAGVELAQVLRGKTPAQTTPQPLALNVPSGMPAHPAPAQQDSAPPAQMAQALGQVLARSVSTGILQPDANAPPPLQTQGVHTPDAPDLTAHLAVPTPRQTGSAPRASHCAGDAMFDLPNWDVPATLAEIPNRLNGIFNDLDQINDGEILNIARSFLYFGLGAEARLALSLREIQDAATELLEGISYIVDAEKAPSPDLLVALRDCGPMGSLWAFLAQPQSAAKPNFPTDSLVQAVQSLPQNLRLHLGPQVVQYLVSLGLSEQARVIRDALERVVQVDTPQLNLARATLDLPDAPPDEARALETALSPERSDDDLLFLLAHRIAGAEHVEPRLLDAARTRIFALRGTQTGREMARLVVQAMVRAGDFGQAFELLDGRDAGFDPAEASVLRWDALSMLAQTAPDTEFVIRVFDQRPWDNANLPAPLAQKLAARLRPLGFDLQADLLAHHATARTASGTPQDDRDLQRARIAQANRTMPDDRTRPPRAERDARPMQADRMNPNEMPDNTRDDAPLAPQEDAETQDRREASLLAQSRDALAQSAALRTRLLSLLAEGAAR
ncbi:hypothetical protein LY56_00786 [Roseinatronobacter thiooxidans]|uniref:Uncharacterized protein n=1 Tax=Roseinatronobacter thiooxidans TaxID=121821 RepID=A0A2W7R7L3_9RHOB|nr:hypothetical protein [Roseinatronobacter thiooxidans]PZX46585.1 hypothetical protein LY56_00786 [Roseinatronobacter thiooxidans]